MRKLLALLTSALMAASLMGVAFAEDVTVNFANFSNLDGTVSVDVSGTDGAEVTLVVVACDKETGMIAAAATDTVELPLSSTPQELSTSVQLDENTVCKYFFFKKGASDTALTLVHTPLDDMKPAKPQNITAPDNKLTMSSLELSWDAALDDWDDAAELSYKVYAGENVISQGSSLTAADSKLDKNTEYKYSIEAIDSGNLVSDKADFTVKTKGGASTRVIGTGNEKTALEEKGVYILLPIGRPEINDGTAGEDFKLGYTLGVYRAGRYARETTTRTNGAVTRLSARVNNDYIDATDKSVIPLDLTDKNITVDVTYFDDDTQIMTMQYRKSSSTDGTATVRKTGTNLWKTVSYRLTDADFRYVMDSGNGGGNFRIYQDTVGLAISDLCITNKSVYNGDAAGLRAKDVPEIRDVIFTMGNLQFAEDTDGNYIQAASGESFEFDITDVRFLSTATDVESAKANVTVEIEYLDEGTGTIDVKYKNTAGTLSAKQVQLEGSGKWKKAVINNITDAKFAIPSKGEIPADYTPSKDDLTVSSSVGLKIKAIRIYPNS